MNVRARRVVGKREVGADGLTNSRGGAAWCRVLTAGAVRGVSRLAHSCQMSATA